MRECRYYGMCRSMACDMRAPLDQRWDETCQPCHDYEPMPDVYGLRSLAQSLVSGQFQRSLNAHDSVIADTCAGYIGKYLGSRYVCSQCNLAREVAMADGSRILVCDGGSDELEQVNPGDDACEKFEER